MRTWTRLRTRALCDGGRHEPREDTTIAAGEPVLERRLESGLVFVYCEACAMRLDGVAPPPVNLPDLEPLRAATVRSAVPEGEWTRFDRQRTATRVRNAIIDARASGRDRQVGSE